MSVHSGLPQPSQSAALEVLRQLLRHESRTPRTLLLAGPDGVGRRAVARWYAALRNCEARLDDPCGRCHACQSFHEGASGEVLSSDYREVGPATTTQDGRTSRRALLRIDQLVPREGGDSDPLASWLQRPPKLRHRVGVIDRAETLTDEAANAFLKVLEEPPRHATLILIAPGPEALLPTVASRCTTVRLGPSEPPSSVRDALAPHPSLRLGRAALWHEALNNRDVSDARRAAVERLLEALDGGLDEAFGAADALAGLWEGDEPEISGLLRELWRQRGPQAYLDGDEALNDLLDGWAGYAQRQLTLRNFVLTLRASAANPSGRRQRL